MLDGDHTCSDQYTIEIDFGQLDWDPCPQRGTTLFRRAEGRHRLTCLAWPDYYVALYNEESFNIPRFEHKGAEVVGSRQLPIDGIDEYEASMVSDRLRRQKVRRKKPHIRRVSAIEMKSTLSVKPIVGSNLSGDVLYLFIIPPIEPDTR